MTTGKTQVKTWPEVTVRHPVEVADALSDFLFEAGAGGLAQEDDPEKPGIMMTRAGFDPGKGLADLPDRLTGFLQKLSEIFDLSEPLTAVWGTVDAGDWAEKWKEGLEPMEIGESLVIKPTWKDYQPGEGRTVIELDPGMAFGTGRHASTYLCLLFIEGLLRDNPRDYRILDIGTGSGILSLACAALGQTGIVAIDNDPEVLPVAEENFKANGLLDRVRLACADTSSVSGAFDLILGNLTSGVLIQAAEDIRGFSAPGAVLILSGILDVQGGEVEAAFEKQGFETTLKLGREEWVAFRMVRKG